MDHLLSGMRPMRIISIWVRYMVIPKLEQEGIILMDMGGGVGKMFPRCQQADH